MKDAEILKVFGERNSKNYKYKELLPDSDDLTIIILKGHLIIEELLYTILEEHCKKPDFLTKAQLRFPQLLQLTRAVVETPLPEEAYLGILELNKLRNSLAHRLKPKDMNVQLEKLYKFSMAAFEFIPENYEKPTQQTKIATESIHSLMEALAVLSGFEEILRKKHEFK